MASPTRPGPTGSPRIDVHLDAAAWREAQADAARCSLTSTPPHLAPVWFYDDVGSALFDQITRLPEYYPTRTERALLQAHVDDLAGLGVRTLVELGSGTSDKTTTILDALCSAGTLEAYVPFDVSERTLRDAACALAQRYPTVAVHGIVGDFHRHLGTIPAGPSRMVAFLGSTIGNLRPDERAGFLASLAAALAPGDRLLLGIDLVKDPEVLVAAYDDAAGTTAEFNRNALRVLNRTIGSDFDVDAFDHVARWDAVEQWIEMRLRARSDQIVAIPGAPRSLVLASGDEIRTEISAKFTVDAMADELHAAGLPVEQAWRAPDDAFALLVATRPA
ncbi:MAG: L-histidine N(alpha)-methyltransferase [Acidimicrobiales bacterium]